ncbi:hypothetical protein [Flavivirga spongiicola]|uniref:O-antigen/teichoic acid export membrane protein n=1 Tax=Flavivirga spongiicola TaxID=421621 RepID=A0ABU7XQI3_9FLAO|nr:hypothetical protein [Flavivirga sp. MEBiC05379]MDO5977703.1 hypothetical protein [Flavivirga sp. MEBiC05379]
MVLKNSKILSRLKTISLYSLSQILTVFSVLLLSFIIIKYHSTELWGQYAEILIWSNFFILFLGFGSQDFLLKSFSNSPSTINQDWSTNISTRSLLLIPSIIIIYFIPIFKGLEVLIFALIGIQFINQSFKVLILFNKDFKFSIWVEFVYNLIILFTCLSIINTLDIKSLLLIISSCQIIKLICYFFYYHKEFTSISYRVKFNIIKQSLPFFIPLAVGTIRVKVDAYYGTYFFNFSTLSKYQVFISFLALAQMGSSFFLNPFLKNFYRSKDSLILKLKKRLFWYGWPFALMITLGMYIVIEYIYELHFTNLQYFLAFIYIIPVLIHVLIVNEYYKKNMQSSIAIIASILAIFQIISGYYLIKLWGINGALILKTLGQWAIILTLWFWIKKKPIMINNG